jgi:hypothetical protein
VTLTKNRTPTGSSPAKVHGHDDVQVALAIDTGRAHDIIPGQQTATASGESKK